MDWKEQIEKFYIGTPEVTPTYIILLCLRHFKRSGGVQFYESQSLLKSKMIYDEIDGDFYINKIHPSCRS